MGGQSIWEDPKYVDSLERNWSEFNRDEIRLRRYLKVMDVEGGKVLDVGCGVGRMARLLDHAEYCGVDGSSEMVARCHKKGLKAYLGQIYSLPQGDKQVDCVLSHAVLCHVGDVPRAVRELWRITKSRLIFSCYVAPWWQLWHRGVTPIWAERDGGGWFQPQNLVPEWMVRRLVKKLNPRYAEFKLTVGETGFGDRLMYVVMDREAREF